MSLHEPQVLDASPDLPEPSRRPVVAGAAAGLWSLFVGMALVSCLVMAVWAVSPNSDGDTAGAWRAASYTWLAAHQVPLDLGGRLLSVLPLGAVVPGLLLTRRAARWAGQLLHAPSPREAGAIVAACAAVYGAGGAGLAWLSAVATDGADPLPALVGTGIVAALGATWGVAPDAGLIVGMRARTPDRVWRTLVGGLAAVVGLFAVGGVLVTVSLVRHSYQVVATSVELNAGLVGTAALTTVAALSLPTLNVWAMSVIVGPGFHVGTGEALTAFGGQVEILPALPVLAAVPAAMPDGAPVLLAVPIALGVLAGRIRWGRDLPTLTWTLESAFGLAIVVAMLVGGLSALAAGSLGGGRLGSVGPQPLLTAACAAGLVVLGFLIHAGSALMRLHWDLHRAERASRARHAHDPAADLDTSTKRASESDAQLSAGPALRASGAGTARSAAGRAARAARRSITIPLSIPRPRGQREGSQPAGTTGAAADPSG